MTDEVGEWFAERTWQRAPWSVGELVEAKAGRSVSVVLPALDEQATVGSVVASVLVGAGSLVDEVVVVDSGSTDDTARVARRAGARVVAREDVLPGVPPRPGKGEVLWRSLAATTGDLVVFLDADLVDPDPGFAPALLGPLLTEQKPVLVKGFYRRPPGKGDEHGGRVTELVARPLLAALRPELRGVVQPLGGEYAARREFLESVPFAGGYGIDIGLLLDAHTRYGLDGIAQVNLGVRDHRHHGLARLGAMAREVTAAALARCGHPAAGSAPLWQFRQSSGRWLPRVHDVPPGDRPPLREVRVEP